MRTIRASFASELSSHHESFGVTDLKSVTGGLSIPTIDLIYLFFPSKSPWAFRGEEGPAKNSMVLDFF